MISKPRILLADDHADFLHEVGPLLEPDFEVVGAVDNGRAALEAVESLGPDVVVLEVCMPLMGGIETARLLHEQSSGTRVVFLSTLQSPALVREAFSSGALAYVFKASAVEDLGPAIRAALEGGSFVSSGE